MHALDAALFDAPMFGTAMVLVNASATFANGRARRRWRRLRDAEGGAEGGAEGDARARVEAAVGVEIDQHGAREAEAEEVEAEGPEAEEEEAEEEEEADAADEAVAAAEEDADESMPEDGHLPQPRRRLLSGRSRRGQPPPPRTHSRHDVGHVIGDLGDLGSLPLAAAWARVSADEPLIAPLGTRAGGTCGERCTCPEDVANAWRRAQVRCDPMSTPPRCYRCHQHDAALLSVLLHQRGWGAAAAAAWQPALEATVRLSNARRTSAGSQAPPVPPARRIYACDALPHPNERQGTRGQREDQMAESK